MFIPTSLVDAPGLKAELKVWDTITDVFSEQNTLAVHHFPMFFSNGRGRREIDILIVNEMIGVCVIEVKGININQIKHIRGHQWTVKDYYEDLINPFEQAENQLNMLSKHLEEDPILYRRFSKRVFIALPYITEKQWIERGFKNDLNTPLPIFKDDLENSSKFLDKLKSFALHHVPERLTESNLFKISELLGISEEEKNQVTLSSRQPFSVLYIITENGEFKNAIQEIEKYLNHGTKIYILSLVNLDISKLGNYDLYLDNFQLNLYYASSKLSKKLSYCKVIDGLKLDLEYFKQIEILFPSFNIGQYLIIHKPILSHQMITAGAGTGKTHVMIDRILFLLMYGDVSLKKIIMITFTNASTNEMKKRLEDKFLLLFTLTGNSKFLIFAEEVKEMQISTIHSFASSILKQLAHEIGYGRNIRIRSYKFEKKRIINILLNEFFSNQQVDLFMNTKVKDYEFVELILGMWEEMEKKGLTSEDIRKIDWGKSISQKTILHEAIKYIFLHCEARLDIIKQEENSITIGDLIRKLKYFTSNDERIKQLSRDHFIFVDEFQDSDAMQIELLASLQKYLNYSLFVVGDVKQAIYRFRGADYRSFQELQDATEEITYDQTSLRLNYRSSSSLLNKLDLLFQEWDSRNWLSYKKTDRLLSNKISQYPNNDFLVLEDYKDEINNALKTLPSDNDKIAFIVRTNKQAKIIKEYCVSKNIPTSENLDGTFFSSEAVRHFKTLVDGLLFFEEPKYMLNALISPYFGYKISYHHLIQFGGNKELINKFINKYTNQDLKKYALLMRSLAPLTVIQKIIFEKQFFERLPKILKEKLIQKNNGQHPAEDEVKLAFLRYEKNLQHLILLIEKNFSSQNATLHKISDWLQLQINTNRTENEPLLEDKIAQVVISTVHRSKGLEYHTVFLPITNSPFNAVEEQYLLEEVFDRNKYLSERKIGWKVKVKDEKESYLYGNNHFEKLKSYEDEERFKEEARLLYVALTRAKQRIYVSLPKKRKVSQESWAAILQSSLTAITKGEKK